MIPKIIHYCWFGPNKLNNTAINCIKSWKKNLPDYQIKLWNEKNVNLDIPFVNKAYAANKYAFVSDYIRLWAIYNEGGIYLDTDMLVLKSLDPFLNYSCFLGKLLIICG